MSSSHHRWVNRLKREAVPPHINFEDLPTQNAVKTKWDEAKAEFLAYFYSLDQAQLEEVVRYEIASCDVITNSQRWEVLIHLANHATDHRAQILAMLHRQFSIKTIEHDMIFFL